MQQERNSPQLFAAVAYNNIDTTHSDINLHASLGAPEVK